MQVGLLRRQQLRDGLFSPTMLTLFYCIYLIGILPLHYYYFLHCSDGTIANCSKEPNWFQAAVLDNYAFLAILAYPLLIAYVQLTRNIDTTFRDMVLVLAGRGVLHVLRGEAVDRQLIPLRPSTSAMARRLDQLQLRAMRLGKWTGWLFAALLGLALLWLGWAIGKDPRWYLPLIGLLHAPLALPLVHTVCARMMRLICYGTAVYRHSGYGVVAIPLVQHSDDAGGFKPLGDYFLAQAYKICPLSGFIIVTTLFLLVKDPIQFRMLGPDSQDAVHEILKWVFIGCSIVILTGQLLAVVVPLRTVHLRMVDFKQEMLGLASIMTRRRQRLLERLSNPRATTSSIERDRAQLAEAERWIGSYEAFPDWPIPRGDLRNFWFMWGGSISAAFAMLTSALFGWVPPG